MYIYLVLPLLLSAHSEIAKRLDADGILFAALTTFDKKERERSIRKIAEREKRYCYRRGTSYCFYFNATAKFRSK